MNVAICDDDENELIRISSLFHQYQLENKAKLMAVTSCNAVELLDKVKKENYDILLLDVLMPGINGIQVAKEIRQFNEQIKIVFLTSSKEFAIESYLVNAYSYLLKPATRKNLYPVLDKVFAQQQQMGDYLVVKCKTGIVRIIFSKIAYVEVLGKKLSFHLSDKKEYTTFAPLSDYEKILLDHSYFIRVHRAFVVNLWQMRELGTKDFVTWNNERVPVSRRLFPQVRKVYMEQLFMEKGEQ